MSTAPAAPDDAALIAHFLERGDQGSFRLLYRRHSPAVFGLLCRLNGGREADAADLLQEAWIRAAASLRGFRGRSRFRTWLCGIALNCHREWHRARGRETSLDTESLGDSGARPAQRAASPQGGQIAQVLQALPPPFLEVLVLHDVEGYTHEEIAEALAIEPGTSKSRLARGRRLFRKRWRGPDRGGER